MTRPGESLRRICLRVFGEQATTQLVDPILADLQHEYDEAASRGASVIRRVWILLSGYVGLGKAAALFAGDHLINEVSDPCSLTRAALTAVLATSGLLLAVTAVPLLQLRADGLEPASPGAVLWALPQAVPVALPAGLALGVIVAARRPLSRRARAFALTVAVMACLGLAFWANHVVPAANQIFREAVAGHALPRGTNELTLAELGARIEAEATSITRPATATVTYPPLVFFWHLRVALIWSPLALTMFALANVSGRQARHPWVLSTLVIGGFIGCFTLVDPALTTAAIERGAWPWFLAWAPTLAPAIAAAWLSTSQRRAA